MTKYSCLRQKEVINVCDGRRLGLICDLEIDMCDGKIRALIVPGCGRFFGLFRDGNTVIPWSRICKVGDDVILVDIDSVSTTPRD